MDIYIGRSRSKDGRQQMDNIRITEWQTQSRSRGRQQNRWRDDTWTIIANITGKTWSQFHIQSKTQFIARQIVSNGILYQGDLYCEITLYLVTTIDL